MNETWQIQECIGGVDQLTFNNIWGKKIMQNINDNKEKQRLHWDVRFINQQCCFHV